MKNKTASFIRFITSMDLAVTLLVMLAAASVIGTLIPQNLPPEQYLVKFGPFWATVLEKLGVFSVYNSFWFITLLIFLIFSLSLCLTERLPSYVKQIRPIPSGKTETCSRITPDRLENCLRQSGFRVSRLKNGLLASKGMVKGWGYGLLHGGILVILIGAFVDANPLLKIALIKGDIAPASYDLLPHEAEDTAHLHVDSGAFRAMLNIAPGEKSDWVFMTLPDGYLIRKLPFVIAVDDFRIDYYDTGMPKGYISTLAIFHPNGQLIRKERISVNRPMTIMGYTIYQSSWQDGGSLVQFQAWRPWSDAPPRKQTLRVGESIKVRIKGQVMTLTLEGFYLHTVINARRGETFNRGPRIVYSLQDATGRKQWFESYMTHWVENGVKVAVTGVASREKGPFQYIMIPLLGNSEEPFRKWLAHLAREDDNTLEGLLMKLFVTGGFQAIEDFVKKNFEENKHNSIKKFYTSILLHRLDTHLDRHVPQADAAWRNTAIMAADALASMNLPMWVQMTHFQQKLKTGLMITHAPGKPLVWLGSLMLIVGIFLMLYTKPVRIWIHLNPSAQTARIQVQVSDQETRKELHEQLARCCKGDTES